MADKVKIQVLKRFRNKHSKNIHEVGDILEVSPSRLRAIDENLPGFVAVIEPEEQEQDEK